MPSNYSQSIHNYQQAKALLDLRRRQGHRRGKLGHNVYLEARTRGRAEVECVAVRFHDTDIVTYLPNGRIILACGGWFTATTKANINIFSPFTVYQEKKVWYVNTGPDFTQANIVPFEDGMILDTPAWAA